MTIKELKERKLIILECISGSRAYGLATPSSDTDIKGVFLMPKKDFYGLEYVPQVNNETNDEVYYEFGRFVELLAVNNPNILELLDSPNNAILYKHPVFAQIRSENILSKLCKNTFGKYAVSQIKKARGLKKKIVNPMEKERKNILAFCRVNYKNGSVPLLDFLKIKAWKQEDCGLVNIPYMPSLYGLYHNTKGEYVGIMRQENSNEVSLSSIPKSAQQEAVLYFNKDGYSAYCKRHREYWAWVENRNEERYRSTENHGKNYDAKNMMHTFRLLHMAIEIAKDKRINVHRQDRDFLLKIKTGAFEYEDLLGLATEKQQVMEEAFAASDLPERPDKKLLNELCFQIRNALYEEGVGV